MDAGLIISSFALLSLGTADRIIHAIRDKEANTTLFVLEITMQLIGFFGILWGVQ